MQPQEKHILLIAIAEIRRIAKAKYNGDIYNNICQIFSELSHEYQEVVLKEFSLLYYMNQDILVSAPSIVVSPIPDSTLPSASNHSGFNNINAPGLVHPNQLAEAGIHLKSEEEMGAEEYNNKELVRIKFFAIKVVIVFVLLAFLLMMVVFLLMPSSSVTVSSVNDGANKAVTVFGVARELFGFD